MPLTADLRGAIALVTGASSGIGAHVAHVLANNGAIVAIGARRTDKLAATARSIAAAGGRAYTVTLDVTDPVSVDAAFAEIEKQSGGTVSILVNNAGVAIAAPAIDIDPAAWDNVIDTNLKGPWLVGRAFALRAIGARHGGSIVNVASIAGERVAGNISVYAASKAGLIQLTKAMALEWARYGIRVNALAPGYFKTDLNAGFFETPAGERMIKTIPQRRLGTYEDLDGAVLLLASDASSFMTGSTIVVDGGHLVSTL